MPVTKTKRDHTIKEAVPLREIFRSENVRIAVEEEPQGERYVRLYVRYRQTSVFAMLTADQALAISDALFEELDQESNETEKKDDSGPVGVI